MNMAANIESVSKDRWKEAQKWECSYWASVQTARARFGKNWMWRLLHLVGAVPKYRGEDWNQWWRQRFDNYSFVPERIHNAIEVGCGPYTNVRLMLDRTRFDHLVLSDPLIRTYAGFKLTFVSDMYRSMNCTIDDHPLEELPFASDYFELAVKINVLDHVRDARACMDTLARIVKPGGILIIGQDLTDDADLDYLKDDAGATGHPIKLRHEWFTEWLGPQRFDPIIFKVLPRAEGRAPDAHYATLIFAGRKRG